MHLVVWASLSFAPKRHELKNDWGGLSGIDLANSISLCRLSLSLLSCLLKILQGVDNSKSRRGWKTEDAGCSGLGGASACASPDLKS